MGSFDVSRTSIDQLTHPGEKVIALAEQLARREQEVTSAIAEARGVEGELEVTQETCVLSSVCLCRFAIFSPVLIVDL